MPKYIDAGAFKEKYLCCGYLPEMSEEEFDDFPAADQIERQRWIPVTERVPSKSGAYIVHCDDSYAPSDERIWGDSVVLVVDWATSLQWLGACLLYAALTMRNVG